MRTPVWTLDSLTKQISGARRGSSIRIDVDTLALLISDVRSLHAPTTVTQAVGAAHSLTVALADVMANASSLAALLEAARREPAEA